MRKLTTPPSILSLGLVTVLGLGSAVAQAAASDTHTVDFTGRIYESGCQIDGDHSDKTVNLGVASASFLKTAENKTAEKNFKLTITGCKLLANSSGDYQAGKIPLELVQLTFKDEHMSVTGSRDKEALTAVQSDNAGASAQVGIHVKLNKKELTFNSGSSKAKLSEYSITPGESAEVGTTVPFTAWFQGIKDAEPVAGNFKGQMTVGFEYL